jgi:5,10-methylenetetrahydromethanopterin reductase
MSDAAADLGIAIWGTQPVAHLVEDVRRAERMGFESAWVIDSQLLCRDVFVTMASCLSATSTIKLATGVTNPITRHVSVTAGALASLDEAYPARVIAGVGTGFSSLRTIGIGAARVAELEAFVRDLQGLLAAEAVPFAGDVREKISWLDAPRAVPVSIAASGPRVTRLAGSIADGAILLHGVSPDLLSGALGWLAEGAAARGRSVTAVDATVWAPLGIGETRATGRDAVRARVASALMQKKPDVFTGRDREEVVRLRQAYHDMGHAAAVPEHAQMVSDRMIERYAIAGDPADVRAQLVALRRCDGINRVVLTAHGGALPFAGVLDLLEEALAG